MASHGGVKGKGVKPCPLYGKTVILKVDMIYNNINNTYNYCVIYGLFVNAGSHLSLQVLQIVYWWTRALSLKDVSHETDVSEHTLVDWNNFIREVCVVHFQNNPILIGGPGMHLQYCMYKYILHVQVVSMCM